MDLAANLGALAHMPCDQLKDLLTAQGVNVREVREGVPRCLLVRVLPVNSQQDQSGPSVVLSVSQ